MAGALFDTRVEARYKGKLYRTVGAATAEMKRSTTRYPRELSRYLRETIRTYLDGVAARVIARNSTPYPGGTTSKSVSMRSGKLLREIKNSVKVTGTGEKIQGHIGGRARARVHELGATIRPNGAKYLAIPLPAALNAKGIPKRKSPRDWPNTFVRRTRKGNLIIFRRSRGKRPPVPLYVLKKQVTIRPRLGIGEEVRKGIPALRKKILRESKQRWGRL